MDNYIIFENILNTFQFKLNNIVVDLNDWIGVIRAGKDLSIDLNKVTDRKFEIKNTFEPNSIIVGTIGKSKFIDLLIANNKIDVSQIKGQWESFLIQTIDDCLVIVGSDKRGTIFGIYDICEKIGVSPWYWWADVPIKKHNTVGVKNGTYIQESPKVKYRGIFINDEEPSFGSWAREKFGGINSKMYKHVFELILRLKGNYMWPAMWGKAFNTDDPNNPVVADEYGIVMGTCHHEPMMCALQEWYNYSNHSSWNYNTNKGKIYLFWKQGINRNAKYENIVTIGMRGECDQAMYGGNIDILKQVINDQRNLIGEAYHKPVSEVPQLWAVYKEVQDYYDHGMRVPDDVIILLSDDNWGNIKRLPTEEEKNHSGGYGMYYHLDYVGGPHSYRWINTTPLPKMWEQLNLTYRYGVDKIWILNVGDLKPMEIPIDFFFKFAFDPDAINQNQIKQYTINWVKEQFSELYAEEIADIVSKYTKYNSWRKPEILNERTFSITNNYEADYILKLWQDLVNQTEEIKNKLSQEYQDAYFELVYFPVKASTQIIEMYISIGKNYTYSKQGRISFNSMLPKIQQLFNKDKEFNEYYNTKLADGKWKHMMDQPHIGTSWNGWDTPDTNIFPALITHLHFLNNFNIGIIIENSNQVQSLDQEITLPVFDNWNLTTHTFEIIQCKAKESLINIKTNNKWIKTNINGSFLLKKDTLIIVDINWDELEYGISKGYIEILHNKKITQINVTANKVNIPNLDNVKLFWGTLNSLISIPAYKPSKINSVKGITWEYIPDYGRNEGGMTIFPVTAKSIEDYTKAPNMEYPIYVSETKSYNIMLFLSPTLNFIPNHNLRIAVGIDDKKPYIINVWNNNSNWGQIVMENCHKVQTLLNIEEGIHTLKIYMIDSAIVIEKIVIYSNNLPQTYFGPKFTNLIKTKYN